MNCFGWPASDGVSGAVERPSAPWQASHGAAFWRCASVPAAKAGSGAGQAEHAGRERPVAPAPARRPRVPHAVTAGS